MLLKFYNFSKQFGGSQIKKLKLSDGHFNLILDVIK